MRLAFYLQLLVLSAGALGQEAVGTSPLDRVRPFLKAHCFECHGPELQKNDVRLDVLSGELSLHGTIVTWQGVLDQLNLGFMPPPKRPRPDADELREVIDLLTERLAVAYAELESTGGETVVRRLNRFELRNTLRDLLYLEGAAFPYGGATKLVDKNGNGRVERGATDLVGEFPADEEVEGFDNIGSRLVMSDFLLELVLRAAEEALALATHEEPRPVVEARRFAGHIRTKGPNPGLESWARGVFPGHDTLFGRYREPGASTGATGRVAADELARVGVGVAARYRITVEASAHNQEHPWGELIHSLQGEPMLLGLHIADSRRGGLHEANPTTRRVNQWELKADGVAREVSAEVWLDASWLPWIGWENGPYDRSLLPSRLVERYHPGAYMAQPGPQAPKEERDGYEPGMARTLLEAGYEGPHIRIHALTVEPLIESWPPRSHVQLYGEEGTEAPGDLLVAFSARAFRRPVQPVEVQRYVALVERELAEGATRAQALRAGYTALLASPRFYYLEEATGSLDSYALASRLSYFLWSSMPDAELLELASTGALTDGDVLAGQVERMLGDPRAASFIHHFTERWLRLDRLGAMPPERSGPFRIYWDRQLEPEMVEQATAFFGHALAENAPITDFIDSDYTFLNERVASILYGRDDVWGDGFRRVEVRDARRGGVLTMPAVMTATANGVDTSPVVRGVWLLENVLGTPPPPPPPDVEPLSPDLRGARTIREQLALHREVDSCSSCHQRIDPLGFPFESFDPMGRWRDVYPVGREPIDTGAVLPGGRRVDGVAGLKAALLEDEQRVLRCLTEKMLTYASGRLLEPGDGGEVTRLVDLLHSRGAGLRDLVHLVTRSEIFTTK